LKGRRSASLPQLSREKAEELTRRLAVPKCPPPGSRPPLEVPLHWEPMAVHTRADPEAQQQHVQLLAQPKPKRSPGPLKHTPPEHGPADPDVQRLHCEYLARPRPKREDRPSQLDLWDARPGLLDEACGSSPAATLGRAARPRLPRRGEGASAPACDEANAAWAEQAERRLEASESQRPSAAMVPPLPLGGYRGPAAARPQAGCGAPPLQPGAPLAPGGGLVGWQLARGCLLKS